MGCKIPHQDLHGASQVALMVKNLPANVGDMRDVCSIPESGRAPGKGMATHSIILARRIPWTEEPGGRQSMGLQRVVHKWSHLAGTHKIFILIGNVGTLLSNDSHNVPPYYDSKYKCLSTIPSLLPGNRYQVSDHGNSVRSRISQLCGILHLGWWSSWE